MMSSMTRVFVYGTLKSGQPNYDLLEKAIASGGAIFVGDAKTLDKFPLIIAGRYNIPYLLYAKGTGNRIHGQVYDVDDVVLKELDCLEEIPYHYQVEDLTVEFTSRTPDSSGKTTNCLIYVCKMFKPEMIELPHHENYDAYGSHGLVYSAEHTQVDSDFIFDVIIRPADM